MKKIFILLMIAAPSLVSAQASTVDYFIGTDSGATSTLAGSLSVAGGAQFGSGTGLLSTVGGYLQTATASTSLLFSDGVLSVVPAGSQGDIQFNDNGVLAGKSGLNWYNYRLTLTLGHSQPEGGCAAEGTDGNCSATIKGPDAGVTDLYGGSIYISGGWGYESARGGDVSIRGGEAGAGSYAGNVHVQGHDVSIGASGGTAYFGGVTSGLWHDGTGIHLINGGSPPNGVTLSTAPLVDDQTFTFPNNSGTFGLLEASQIWSGDNTFSKGASATTTVNFGELGDASSRSCFNTKNTDGDDISFYFVGTSMVVENNVCQ